MKEQKIAGQGGPDYEYEERAAIREVEGSFERFEANQLALIDLRERASKPDVDSQKAIQEQQKKEAEPGAAHQQSSPKKEKIEQLRRKAEQTRKLMLAETDPQRSKELLTEWKEIYSQIIELKKGASKW